MGWYDGGDELLEEERHVRLGENALVAGIAFALFWANFGLSWHFSSRRVPEFSGFTAAQKADWCSRCVCGRWRAAQGFRVSYQEGFGLACTQSKLDHPRSAGRDRRGLRAGGYQLGR